MRRLSVLVLFCLASGCAGVAFAPAGSGNWLGRANGWPVGPLGLAAADEDVTHEETDTEETVHEEYDTAGEAAPVPGPTEAVTVSPEDFVPGERRPHRFGLHLGLQTFLNTAQLDAGTVSADALIGVYYRLCPWDKLSLEFGLQYTSATLGDYGSNVEAETQITAYRGAALYYLKKGSGGAATYATGGLSIVAESVSYENRGDGHPLADYENSNLAMSLGIGEELLGGKIDLRYDMTLPLGSESGSSYHYLTVGYTF